MEIVKGIFSVFSNLAGIIFGFGGNALAAGAGVGNFISKLREMLVEGGGIKKFFDFTKFRSPKAWRYYSDR